MWESLIIQPMTNLLLWIYNLLGHGPHTFGLAIILFTIVIRAVTWPLNAQQMKGAQAMREMQNDKEWQAIQKKYAKDREKLAQEQMRIYKEKGINPFGSCLPTLIQFPIIFTVLQATNIVGTFGNAGNGVRVFTSDGFGSFLATYTPTTLTLSGFTPVFRESPTAFGSLQIDTTKLQAIAGPSQVDWKDGIREMVQALAPQLLSKRA